MICAMKGLLSWLREEASRCSGMVLQGQGKFPEGGRMKQESVLQLVKKLGNRKECLSGR